MPSAVGRRGARVGWTPTGSLEPLTATTTYALFRWTKDNSWSSSSVSFTVADLDRPAPGSVRYDRSSGDGDAAATVPIRELTARVCEGG
ncbi:hypothetical protein [Streptomyces sp. CBMA29]|uniref:hypothetical protein n=1 Tax=Streptomyces sp. CBMA29 TaxID=1896314 RepID=UPI0016619FC4|nr:hypothetical protein [Streptomyces sp. CBMA29]MBD0736449.1 hypothetical protein [Streptomyces sp. CBMA29]